MKRAHLYVTGTVQGVFFRESTKAEALRHNVRGWVRNLPDGRVEAVLEGEEYGVDAVIQWCHRGPERARVRHVEVAVQEPTGEFHGFEVLRQGR